MTIDSFWLWLYRVLALLAFIKIVQANRDPQKFVVNAYTYSIGNRFIWEFFIKKKNLQRPFFIILLILSLSLLIITFIL